MSRKITRYRTVVFLSVMLILVAVAAACGGDGDEDRTEPAVAGTAADQLAEAIVEEMATPTATNPPVPTATSTPLPPTATPTPTNTPTPTPIPEVPIGEVQQIDPNALPNFTLSLAYNVEGVANQDVTDMALEIQQSEPHNYRLVVTTNATKIETWMVDGTTYLKQGDGSVVALPAGTDSGLFSPMMFVQTIPRLDPSVVGVEAGAESINGRETVHYHVDGDDFLSKLIALPDGSPTNVAGEVDIWLDKELRFMVKQAGNVTWTNPDGSPGSISTVYEIKDIGSTARVEPPQ